MKKNVNVEIVKGFKFSFVVPKSKAGQILAKAFESDVELSYKNLAGDALTTTVKGIAESEQVGNLLDIVETALESHQEKLDFLNTFKYKNCEYGKLMAIPFAEPVVKKVPINKKS